jgi:hypothetical protein
MYGVLLPPLLVAMNTILVFFDDYSKFTWIYFLKRKSDALTAFVNFHKLVERKLDRKIFTVQSDWGGEYEKLNSLF